MKKIVWLFALMLIFTGCNKEKKESWNLDKIDDKLMAYQEKGEMFKDCEKISLEKMASKYDFHDTYIEEGIIRMSSTTVNYNMYFILKPKEGKESEVEKEMENFFTSFADMIQNYYPEEYTKVKNRLERKIDGYLIYIVSEDNETVLSLIEEGKNGIF